MVATIGGDGTRMTDYFPGAQDVLAMYAGKDGLIHTSGSLYAGYAVAEGAIRGKDLDQIAIQGNSILDTSALDPPAFKVYRLERLAGHHLKEVMGKHYHRRKELRSPVVESAQVSARFAGAKKMNKNKFLRFTLCILSIFIVNCGFGTEYGVKTIISPDGEKFYFRRVVKGLNYDTLALSAYSKNYCRT